MVIIMQPALHVSPMYTLLTGSKGGGGYDTPGESCVGKDGALQPELSTLEPGIKPWSRRWLDIL